MSSITAPIRGARRIGLAAIEAILIAAIIGLAIAAAGPILGTSSDVPGVGSVGAATNLKFNLAVDHPEGTSVNDTEVVYYARNLKGGLGGTALYNVRHTCYEGNVAIVVQTKGLYFAPNSKTGNAFFFTFGDRCTGVVIDLADSGTNARSAGAELSNTVSYGTNPLP